MDTLSAASAGPSNQMHLNTSNRSSASLSPIPVEITIRFATALPDLAIYIRDASTTTVSWLKREIRRLRPADAGKRRLRLIYGGRVLVAGEGRTLAEQMRLRRAVEPPPLEMGNVKTEREKAIGMGVGKGKGKEKVVEVKDKEGDKGGKESDAIVKRVYVHCAVGDEASEEEINAEEEETAHITTSNNDQPARSTLPQPQGFDRLLSAGFTEADVAALRAQFYRIHNISPDSPPETSRLLEERWIDEAAGAGTGELADGSPTGTYEDIFFGVAIGFFWPVAVLALREEGIFTKRRGMAIVAGLLVNLLAAVLRFSS